MHLILWKTASKPLPSICKTNTTTLGQDLLSSEMALFTVKTTDYKQKRLIRGDLETAGSQSQHLGKNTVDLGLEYVTCKLIFHLKFFLLTEKKTLRIMQLQRDAWDLHTQNRTFLLNTQERETRETSPLRLRSTSLV